VKKLKKPIKKGLLMLFLLMFSASLANMAKVHAQPIVNRFYMEPPKLAAEIGTKFNVIIMVEDGVNLFTLGAGLRWNPAFLNFSSVQKGDYFAGKMEMFMQPVVDYGAGTAEGIAWTLLGELQGVDGNGSLATVEFEVVSIGGDTVDLYDAEAFDFYGAKWGPIDSSHDCYATLVETIKHPITYETHEFNVTTVSNSSVSQVLFNQPGKKISFNVTGPDGTTGFCNVTMPRTMMDCANLDNWTIFIESDLITDNCTMNRDADYTYISIPYTHSTQLIQIISTVVVAEFHSAMILIIFLMASLIAFLLSKKQLMKRKV